MIKALVTGAGGFVGPHLVARLQEHGQDVIELDKGNGPDLRDPQAWRSVVSETAPDIIYHLAGWSNVGSSWAKPATCFEVNAVGTVNVLEAARHGYVGKVIMVSSADVYAQATDAAITETHPTEARNPYATSKLAAELACRQFYSGYDLPVVVARPFNHIGPGQGSGFVVADFAKQVIAVEREELAAVKHGDLSVKRDFTDVRDVVAAYHSLGEKGIPGETYNICSESPVQISDILEKLTMLSPGKIPKQEDAQRLRPVDCPTKFGDASKLKATTGWAPQYSLEETLADIVDAERLLK